MSKAKELLEMFDEDKSDFEKLVYDLMKLQRETKTPHANTVVEYFHKIASSLDSNDTKTALKSLEMLKSYLEKE